MGLANLLKVGSVYKTAEVEQKREIISSMFPEKLHFENSAVRTGRVNEAARLIYLLDSQLAPNKKGQNSSKSVLSSQVALSVQISNLFLLDLKKLIDISG